MDLDGVRVVDFSTTVPGPAATQLLADLGADVISVEPPDGDPARRVDAAGRTGAVFEALNRGKRSVTLDLTSAPGRDAADQLVDGVDAVIEGFRPGVAERLGVDYASVAERNPEVVYCSVTGFGQTGPYRDRPAHDLTITGMAGFLDLNRRSREETPAIPGFSVADVSSGHFAAVCVLGGLLSRELGGGGTYVDASMLEATMSLSRGVVPAARADTDPEPRGTEFTGRDPWYDVYECADGRYVTLAALEPALRDTTREVLGAPDLSDADEGDPAVREALREELAATFAERSRDEWVDCLPDGVPVAPVNTIAEARVDRQITERGFVRGEELPHFAFPALVGAIGDRPDAGEAVPRHGEHTADVLREAGASPSLIDRVTEE